MAGILRAVLADEIAAGSLKEFLVSMPDVGQVDDIVIERGSPRATP